VLITKPEQGSAMIFMKRAALLSLSCLLLLTSASQSQEAKTEYSTHISIGYGNSFGGFGLCVQGDISEYMALHAGGGYFPLSKVYSNAKDMFMASGGAKVYLMKKSATRFFLDVQFGMLGGEYNETTEYLASSTRYTKGQKALYGPTALLGLEIFLGNGAFGFVFAGGASYNLAEIEWKEVKVLGAIDLGIVIRF
jgi:hypothetical protein